MTTPFLSWLSQPAVSISVPDGRVPAPEEGGHREGEAPGSGSRDGRGNGGGKGLGLDKGGQEPGHTVSPANVVRTAASYASVLLWFSILTAAAEAAVRGSRKNRTRPRSEE